MHLTILTPKHATASGEEIKAARTNDSKNLIKLLLNLMKYLYIPIINDKNTNAAGVNIRIGP